MGVLNTALSAASISMSSYQTYQDAEQKRREAELAAGSLEAQAARKELEADETLKIGELNQLEKIAEGRKDIARQKTDYAAAGVKVDSGSTLAVAADKAAWSEYERQKLEYESSLESWGLRYDAALLRQEAANARAGASSGGGALQAAIAGGKQWTGLFKQQ